MRKILRLCLRITIGLSALSLVPSPVFALDCKNSLSVDKFGPCPSGLAEFEQVFSSIISAAVGLGFIVLLVMLISAGIKYLTSGGEPKAIQAAHQTVTWALLGVVFMAVAWIILQIIKVFTGIDVTVFNIKILV